MEVIAEAPKLTDSVTTAFNYSVDTQVGIYENEKDVRTIYMDIEITFGWSGKDDIIHVVDYDKVKDRLDKCFKDRHFNLIETVAKQAAETVYSFSTPYHVIYKVRVVAEKGLNVSNYATATYTKGK